MKRIYCCSISPLPSVTSCTYTSGISLQYELLELNNLEQKCDKFRMFRKGEIFRFDFTAIPDSLEENYMNTHFIIIIVII
jgi:hypothetical protein